MVYLGANVPLEKLDSAIQTVKPGIVVSTAQLAYGALIFNTLPRLQERILGSFLGKSFAKAVQSVEALMLNPPEIGSVHVLST